MSSETNENINKKSIIICKYMKLLYVMLMT
ncbi:hypothetical protein DFH76_002147 [Clostridium beijerinckii]|nr:hypothetical protein [Clostridium beijerinckii]NSA89475.1 hypothetical protein [Clostridium beijerinckii]